MIVVYKEKKNYLNIFKYFQINIRIQICTEYLEEIQSNAFSRMRQSQEELRNLQKNNLKNEKQQLILEHQKIYSIITEIYDRFLYLMKLIVSTKSNFLNS